MTVLELVLIIILYIVIGLLSVKPITKVMASYPTTVLDVITIVGLIILYPVFWAVVAIVTTVFVFKEFYGED